MERGAVPSGAHPTRERFVPASREAIAAAAAAFERRNPGWSVTILPDAQPLRPDVLGARRVGRGPRRDVSTSDAEASARRFVTENAAFLGLTVPDARRLEAKVHPYPPMRGSTDRVVWSVSFTGTTIQPGYEAFPSVAQEHGLTVLVSDDGEVASCGGGLGGAPELHLRTTPGLDAEAPALLASVLGQPLFAYDAAGGVPGTYVVTFRKRSIGAVLREDIQAVRLTIEREYEPRGAVTYFLAYEVRVSKDGKDQVFLLDPDTGAILRSPKAPGPIVP